LLDAGPIYASIDVRDRHHAACAELVQTHPGPLIIPQLVIAEVAHFISTRLDARAEVRFIADLSNGGYLVEPVLPPDWVRIAELVWQYRDLALGIVDASIVATAERLGIVEVATLDRRHFSAVRPAHAMAFDLLPRIS
jgi:predicted nucleic acid-binding protein